jgi:hypothetical protein
MMTLRNRYLFLSYVTTLKISPCTNMTLTLALGWIILFMGDMGEGSLHREDEVTVTHGN